MPSHSSHDPATSGHGRAPLQRRRLSSSTRYFVRHYAEMVAAMVLGMNVLGVPAGWALGAVGSSLSELKTDAPSLMLLGMAVTMTAPMVAWMRFRGHGWRLCNEMAASMLIPALGALALLRAGVVTGTAALGIEHMAMLPSMLAAMLLRRDEYTRPQLRHGPVAA